MTNYQHMKVFSFFGEEEQILKLKEEVEELVTELRLKIPYKPCVIDEIADVLNVCGFVLSTAVSSSEGNDELPGRQYIRHLCKRARGLSSLDLSPEKRKGLRRGPIG